MKNSKPTIYDPAFLPNNIYSGVPSWLNLPVLEKENYPMASAEVTMIPQNYVTLTDENDIRQLNRTLDLLDEDDDVQDVFHNWDE